MSFAIRAATAEDGPAIGKLFLDADLADLGVDWSKGVRGWFVAAREGGEIVGAIQVVPARPFGFIGDVVVATTARGRGGDGVGRLAKRPGTVGFTLCVCALDYLQRCGAQVALGVTDKPGLLRMLTRYGGVDLGSHRLVARDLTTWPGTER